MDYMDLDVQCSQKAVKLNHSLTQRWFRKWWLGTIMQQAITRGVTIRRATIQYVSRYVGRDTTSDTISDDTPTNLESQTHFN